MPFFIHSITMSEEIEQHSLGETLGLILGLYAFSLIVSIVYLFCHVSRQKSSWIIFILSVAYASLFVFLNIMAIFDLFFNHKKDFDKLFNFLKKFYFGFNIVDIALGFFLFNILIYYLESGYYSKSKKLFDGIIRYVRSIKKMSTCEKFVAIAISVPLIAGLLVILIIYRKHFNLGKNPLDYTDIIFNCYAIFEIYTGVGFFIYQLIKDCKRRNNENLIKRYCNYSIKKIVFKTEKYLKSINDTYKHLSIIAPVFENDTSYPYYIYLQNKFNKVKETKNLLSWYIIDNNDNSVNINNTKDKYSDTVEKFGKNQIKEEPNYIQNLNNPNGQEIQVKMDSKTNIRENQKKPLEENLETSTSIRKYKKAVRRIDKLKKLYKEIEIEKNAANKKTKGSCGLVILYIAFFIAIVTDFILPLAFDYEKDYYDKDNKADLFDKDESDAMNVATGIVGMIVASIICCPYTVITIYTTIRKRYITGDFLYDKKINDDISLMKTVQLICGYSFAIVYCNLYFWKTIDSKGNLGKPYFYDEIVIPDYMFKQGVSIYMIIKIVLIVGSIFAHLYLDNTFIFKNDLAEYNKLGDNCEYDDNNFKLSLQDNLIIDNLLKK